MIQGLSLPLKDINGGSAKMPTMREVLRLVANVKAKSPEDAKMTVSIIETLVGDVDSIELTEAEHKLMVETFSRNQMELSAWVQGQVLRYLEATA